MSESAGCWAVLELAVVDVVPDVVAEGRVTFEDGGMVALDVPLAVFPASGARGDSQAPRATANPAIATITPRAVHQGLECHPGWPPEEFGLFVKALLHNDRRL